MTNLYFFHLHACYSIFKNFFCAGIQFFVVLNSYDEFFEKCVNQIMKYGINLFGFTATTNLIIIARELPTTHYLNVLMPIIKSETFEKNVRFFSIILISQPKYVMVLLESYPEMFLGNMHKIDKDIFKYTKFDFLNNSIVFDYIRCFRKIHELFEANGMNNEMKDYLSLISHVINRKDLLSRLIDFNSITINQLDNIIWYIKLVGNRRELNKIIISLREQLALDSNNAVFRAILDKI